MGKWMFLVVLMLVVLMFTSSVALAAPRQIPAPALDLEGARVQSYTGYASDPEVWDGPNRGRKGWYISTPFVYVKDQINGAVRQMGGRLVSGPARPGDYVVIWRAVPQPITSRWGGVRVGWRDGAVAVPLTVRVSLTRKIYRVEQDHSWTMVSDVTETGSAKAGLSGVDIDRIGSIRGQGLGVFVGRYESLENAEQKAVLSALEQMLERPKMATSSNEPIGVIKVEGDLVLIDAGSARGIGEGDHFAIYAPGSFDDNPRTGIVVDQNTSDAYVATVRVLTVMDHKAYCRVVSGDIQDIQRGDRLVRTELPSEEAPKL